MWPVEMNWIPARPTLFRAELFDGFVVVAQVFMQHLRSINAQSHTRIDTPVPPKAIRALYYRHFLRPTLAGMPYCRELALHLDCQYSNGNNANNVDRFFIAYECKRANTARNKMTFIYFSWQSVTVFHTKWNW